jgi:hypothetical protein
MAAIENDNEDDHSLEQDGIDPLQRYYRVSRHAVTPPRRRPSGKRREMLKTCQSKRQRVEWVVGRGSVRTGRRASSARYGGPIPQSSLYPLSNRPRRRSRSRFAPSPA